MNIYDYDRTAAATPMSAEEFKREVEKHLNIGDRQVSVRVDTSFGTVGVYINLVNLPKGVGGAGGGAEAENNRMMFSVRFPDNPADKVKVEQTVSRMDRKYKMRAKSGHPAQVAKYVADFINKVVKEVEPKFTHTKQAYDYDRSGSYDRSRNEVNPGEHGVLQTIFKYRDRSFGYATLAKHLTPFQRGLVDKLVKEGYVREAKSDEGTTYKLTSDGERALNNYRGT